MTDCAWNNPEEGLEYMGTTDEGDKVYVYKRPMAKCMICGKEDYKDKMVEIITSKAHYECMECSESGMGKARARLNEMAFLCKKKKRAK